MLQQIGCTFSYTELQHEFKSHPTSVNSLQPNTVGNSDAVAGKEVNSINPKDWATIIFTSGSTGSPKAVVHSLANHFYNALGANEQMPLNPGDRWLLSLPMYHVSGLAILFRTLLSGAAMVIPAIVHAHANAGISFEPFPYAINCGLWPWWNLPTLRNMRCLRMPV